MKKIVLLFSAVFLVAAGCNTKTVSTQGSQQAASSASSGSSSQAAASVKVNNIDDVVNVLEQNSANEQSAATSLNDSDLTNTDSTALNNFTGVPNGN